MKIVAFFVAFVNAIFLSKMLFQLLDAGKISTSAGADLPIPVSAFLIAWLSLGCLCAWKAMQQ